MKKLIVSLILILAFNVFVFGDDTLIKEDKALRNEIIQLQQMILEKAERRVEIRGVLRYIEKKKAEKAEVE